MEPFVHVFDPFVVAVQLRKVSGIRLAQPCVLKNRLTAPAEAV